MRLQMSRHHLVTYEIIVIIVKLAHPLGKIDCLSVNPRGLGGRNFNGAPYKAVRYWDKTGLIWFNGRPLGIPAKKSSKSIESPPANNTALFSDIMASCSTFSAMRKKPLKPTASI